MYMLQRALTVPHFFTFTKRKKNVVPFYTGRYNNCKNDFKSQREKKNKYPVAEDENFILLWKETSISYEKKLSFYMTMTVLVFHVFT
jgi:hypothetical protein